MKEGRVTPLYTRLSTESTEKILISSQEYVSKQIDRAEFNKEFKSVFESVSKNSDQS